MHASQTTKTGRRAAWTALAAAFACMLAPLRATAQDPDQSSSGAEVAVDPNLFSIPETLLVRALYERARGHLAAQRWSEAIADLQTILEEHKGDILPGDRPRSKSGRMSEGVVHAGAPVRASALLQGLPNEARKLYRDRYEVDATRALDTARASRDARALGEVGRRWPLCAAAVKAFVSLGDLELERGHEVEARYAWERALRLRLLDPALVLRSADDWKAARARVTTAADTSAGADDSAGLQRRIDFAMAHADAVAARTDAGQRNLRLPALEEASGPPPGEGGDVWPQAYELKGNPWTTDPFRDALFPVRNGDTLLVSTSLHVVALHAYTGELLWDSGEPQGWKDLTTAARVELFRGIDPDAALIAPATSGSVVVAALQLPFALLSSDKYQQIQITVPIPERRLFAFDVATGKKLWDHTPPPGWDGDGGTFSDRMSIAGPPVIAGSRVLAPCVRMQGRIYYNVGCFDLDTGALLWSSDVISGQRELNMFGRAEHEFCAAPLRVEGDKVIAVTQLGTVACLDLFSGDILWETLHETIPMPRTRQFYAPRMMAVWRNSPPVVENGIVLATPTNCPDLIALDLQTGSLLWSTSSTLLANLFGRTLPNQAFPSNVLLGAAPDAIYLGIGGDKIVALDMPAGLSEPTRVRAKWSWKDDAASTRAGRPVVCKDSIVVPGVNDRIDLDRETGAKLRAIPWSAGGNVLIGSGELFSVSGHSVQGFFEWDVLVTRARAELAKTPNDPPAVLALARLLDGRGTSEWQRGSSEAARAHFAEARAVLERVLTGSAADDVRAILRPEYHAVLRGEARVRASLADSNGAIADLRAARVYAPDPESMRDTLLEELAILRERADTAGADVTGMQAALDELARTGEDLPLEAERRVDASAFGARFVPIAGRVVDESVEPVLLPVGLWVRLEEAAQHARAHDVPAEFADLHTILERWHDVDLGEATAGDLAAERVGALLNAGQRDGYEIYEKRAQDLFEAGVRTRDANALIQVARLYPYSRASRAANDARLDIALEQGDVETAARIVGTELPQSWNMDSGSERETRLVLRLARALEQSGNLEAAGALERALAVAHGDLVVEDVHRTAAKPKDDTAKPTNDTAKPKDDAAKPKDDTAKPKDNTAKPHEDAAKPAAGNVSPPATAPGSASPGSAPMTTLRAVAEHAPQFTELSRAPLVGTFRRDPDKLLDIPWSGEYELLGEPLPKESVQDLAAGRPQRLVYALTSTSMRRAVQIVELSSDDPGATRWSYDLPFDARPASNGPGSWNRRAAFAAGRVMLATTTSGVIAVDTQDGHQAWKWQPEDMPVETVSIACASGIAVVVVTPRGEPEHWFVVGLDAHSGALLWRDNQMENGLQRMPLVSGGHVVFLPATQRKSVVVRDLFTGARVRHFDLDTAISTAADQDAWIEGDVLMVPWFNELRTVERDHILAFDLRTGARAWRVGFDEGAPKSGPSDLPVRRWLRGVLQQDGKTWLVLQTSEDMTLFALDTRIGALTPLSVRRLGAGDLLLGLPRVGRVELPPGPIFAISSNPRSSRDALLRCIDLANGDAWSQSLGLEFGDILPAPPMPALSDSTVAVAYASRAAQSVTMSISFFDVRTGALGGRRDMLPNGRDVPQLMPLGDTLLVRTRNSMEILR
jgi:outer membrane protein assembly factor BamB